MTEFDTDLLRLVPHQDPLPRVLHNSPMAVLLVDLTAGTVVYANRLAGEFAPGLRLPAAINQWADAAGLRDADGQPLSATSSPLSRIAAGQPVVGEAVTAQRPAGGIAARAPLWVVGLPLVETPELASRALVVIFEVTSAAGERAVTELVSLRERAVLASDVSFTISDPRQPGNPLVWCNPAFSRVTGYAFDEAVGRNCRFLQGPATDPAAVAAIRTALAREEPLTVVLLNYRKDGTAFWNELSINPVFGAGGELSHFVGVQADVSLRVESDRQRDVALRVAQQAQADLALLAETTTLLAASLDVPTALHRLASLCVPRLADWCAVDLLDDDGVHIRRVAAAHADPERTALVYQLQERDPVTVVDATPVAQVLRSGEPLLLADAPDGWQADPTVAAMVREVGARSVMVLPLRARSRVLGTLSLVLVDRARPAYTAHDVDLGADLARRAALSVDNARLYAREHAVAEALQRSLLPELPTVAGLQVHATYLPSSSQAQVGGDWYDVLVLPDGSVGIAIGDVMGHDLEAAAAMGQLRGVLRSYAWEGDAPARVLDRLDRLVQGLDMAQLATTCYARVERDRGGALRTLRYANAGHLAPLLRHPDGRVVELDGARSMLIGAPDSDARDDAAVDLAPGSVVLLFTDGLVEGRDRPLDDGIAALRAVLAEYRPEQGVQVLCRDVTERLGAAHSDDDVALLAVQVDR